MKTSRDYLDLVTAGRAQTVLLSWLPTKVKEEKLSFVYLKDVHRLFFDQFEPQGLNREDYSMPVFSKMLRTVLKEMGIYEKCQFKRRNAGIVVWGLTFCTADEKKLGTTGQDLPLNEIRPYLPLANLPA